MTLIPILLGDIVPPSTAFYSERRSRHNITPALRRVLCLEETLARAELAPPRTVRAGDMVAALLHPTKEWGVRRAEVVKVCKDRQAMVRLVDAGGVSIKVDAKAQIKRLPEDCLSSPFLYRKLVLPNLSPSTCLTLKDLVDAASKTFLDVDTDELVLSFDLERSWEDMEPVLRRFHGLLGGRYMISVTKLLTDAGLVEKVEEEDGTGSSPRFYSASGSPIKAASSIYVAPIKSEFSICDRIRVMEEKNLFAISDDDENDFSLPPGMSFDNLASLELAECSLATAPGMSDDEHNEDLVAAQEQYEEEGQLDDDHFFVSPLKERYESDVIPEEQSDQPSEDGIGELDERQWSALHPGSLTPVCITEVMSPLQFYVRKEERKEDLEKLETRLNDEIGDMEQLESCHLKRGSVCLAPLTEVDDNGNDVPVRWIRAILHEMFEGTWARIFLVDHGLERVVCADQLKVMKEEILELLPFQAILCSLKGVQPSKGDEELWKHAGDLLFELSTRECGSQECFLVNTAAVPLPEKHQIEPEPQIVTMFIRDNLTEIAKLLEQRGLIELEPEPEAEPWNRAAALAEHMKRIDQEFHPDLPSLALTEPLDTDDLDCQKRDMLVFWRFIPETSTLELSSELSIALKTTRVTQHCLATMGSVQIQALLIRRGPSKFEQGYTLLQTETPVQLAFEADPTCTRMERRGNSLVVSVEVPSGTGVDVDSLFERCTAKASWLLPSEDEDADPEEDDCPFERKQPRNKKDCEYEFQDLSSSDNNYSFFYK